jgi:hypothetical protein
MMVATTFGNRGLVASERGRYMGLLRTKVGACRRSSDM